MLWAGRAHRRTDVAPSVPDRMLEQRESSDSPSQGPGMRIYDRISMGGCRERPFARSQATLFLVLLYCFLFIAQIASTERRRPRGPRADPLTDASSCRRPEGPGRRGLAGGELRPGSPAGRPPHSVRGIFLVWIGRGRDLYRSKECLAYFVMSNPQRNRVYGRRGS